MNGIQGRCGHGPRQPLLVISPFAKSNFVDHSLTDQSSIIHFIEELIESGHAYASGGDVYFRVASFADYGAIKQTLPEALVWLWRGYRPQP